MKVTLLGVGGSAGSPQIGGADGGGDWGSLNPAEPRNRRTRPSIVIETVDNKRILVDTGPDLRIQMTAAGIGRVDAVVYTHAHADHIAGLDDVRILNRIMDAPMPAFADQKTWDELKLRFDYAFKPFSGGFFYRPVLHPYILIPGKSSDIMGLSFQVIDQDHGYTRTLGLRAGGFAYCTDVMALDEAAHSALRNLEVLVVDCFTSGPPHPTHANLDLVLTWVSRLQPRRTVLTHMGPDMDYGWLTRILPDGIEPGYDGLVIRL